MEEATTIDWKPRRWTRFLVPAAWVLASYVLAGAFLCVFFDIRCPGDVWAYRCMIKKPPHPIWKDLALRRIHKGSDLARIIRKYPPTRQEQWELYTVLFYTESETDGLRVIATHGSLVYADAWGYWDWDWSSRWGRWNYVFFANSAHSKLLDEAHDRYLDRVRLEEQAWQIHRAIATGQDVFSCRWIERHESANIHSEEMTRRYEEIYGADYMSLLSGPPELTVEIAEVLSGDLEPGTELTFSGKECTESDLAEPRTVFLHFDDARTIGSDFKGGELYMTVPRKAIEWYQSLTPEQIKDFEARHSAGTTP